MGVRALTASPVTVVLPFFHLGVRHVWVAIRVRDGAGVESAEEHIRGKYEEDWPCGEGCRGLEKAQGGATFSASRAFNKTATSIIYCGMVQGVPSVQ